MGISKIEGIESNVVRTLVTSLEDTNATIHQKSLASMILSITNGATQTGIVSERWKEATDIMLQKKENINKEVSLLFTTTSDTLKSAIIHSVAIARYSGKI